MRVLPKIQEDDIGKTQKTISIEPTQTRKGNRTREFGNINEIVKKFFSRLDSNLPHHTWSVLKLDL